MALPRMTFEELWEASVVGSGLSRFCKERRRARYLWRRHAIPARATAWDVLRAWLNAVDTYPHDDPGVTADGLDWTDITFVCAHMLSVEAAEALADRLGWPHGASRARIVFDVMSWDKDLWEVVRDVLCEHHQQPVTPRAV